jgi:serine/threonine protein kinase
MPTAAEYNQAIQNLHVTARDEELKGGEPALSPLGLPLEYAGGFAVVYQVRCPKTGKTWAVKCFTKEVEHRRERYDAISQHLRRVQLPFMVGFEYQEQGLLVGGRRHPIVKMDWIEGAPLNQFVAENLEQRGTLRQLLRLWVRLAQQLDAAEVTHADLQHGNVLLVPPAREGEGPRLRLVDYDGMYVPALADRPSGELGHRAYQHPQRLRDEIYSAEVDRFSHLVIYGALHSLIAGGRDLWDRYDNQDNLLFRDEDFASPGESKLFRELWEVQDPAVHVLVGRLLLATQAPLDNVPRLDDLHHDGKLLGLSRDEEQRTASIILAATTAAGVALPQTPKSKLAAQDIERSAPMPTAREYNQAIQNLHVTARDEELKGGEPALSPLGLPLEYAGGFAVVYQVHCPKTGKTWAVKCFTKEVDHRRERYEAISQHLQQAQLPFMVGFKYQEQGLCVNGRWEPIVKMDWIEGAPLNRFVAENLDRPATLRQLVRLWVRLAQRLDAAEVTHADLQHGNVLLVPPAREGEGPRLRLVDYDGMHVPALADRPSGELGHRAYQHPQRLSDEIYSAQVDHFSHLAIYCALHCLLAGGYDLWNRYNNHDNLLFREEDFSNPRESKLFRELWELPDPAVHVLVGRLLLATQTPLDNVPRLEELHKDGKLVALRRDEDEQAGAMLLRAERLPTLSDGDFTDVLGAPKERIEEAFKLEMSSEKKTTVKCKGCGNSVAIRSRLIEISQLVFCPVCGDAIDFRVIQPSIDRKLDLGERMPGLGEGKPDSAKHQSAQVPSLYDRFREACSFRVEVDWEQICLAVGVGVGVLIAVILVRFRLSDELRENLVLFAVPGSFLLLGLFVRYLLSK